MNICLLTGRLTKTPELRYTQNNTAFTQFTIAVNRPKKKDGTQEADFISCVAWNKTAELICTYLSKGSLVGLEGRIQTGTYDKQDGTKGYTTDVYVQKIEFLESKKSETQNATQITPQEVEQNTTDPFSDFGNVVSIDEFLD